MHPFLIDENLPAELAGLAREAGFEAAAVRDVMPAARDAAILERLAAGGEVLPGARSKPRARNGRRLGRPPPPQGAVDLHRHAGGSGPGGVHDILLVRVAAA